MDTSVNKNISPMYTEIHHEERNIFSIVEVVDIRSNLLRATQILDTAAKDKYIFIRESYLQQREKLVNDGENTEEFEIDVQGIDY
jgi:ABC-type transporter lipoprotein component MlaA